MKTADAIEANWKHIVADLYDRGGWMELRAIGLDGRYYTVSKLNYEEALHRAGLSVETALLSCFPES